MIFHSSTDIVFCLVLVFFTAGCTGVRPSGLGVRDNKLAPCPASPNCVSSQAGDRDHSIQPIACTTDTPAAMADLKKIILSMKRSRIVTETEYYLHAEFTSAIWRFVDDVEFYADESAGVIHVRSASRLGTSDFGVNRKRVEAIREAWKALGR
jgi:uncharacterized protein (DUF1499 family)